MKQLAPILTSLVALVLAGCGRHEHAHHHDHDGHDHGTHAHSHEAPHGGAPVVLGDEAFHLEFVRDADAGTLSAYVLDGHMENFVRVTNESLTITVNGADALTLTAQSNTATGETVGDSAHFLARAEWLLTTSNFQAVIPSVAVRGTIFTNVSFSFPEGNE